VRLSKSVKLAIAASVVALLAGTVVLATAPERRLDLFPLLGKRLLISDRIFGGASDVGLDSTARGIRFHYGLSPVSSHPWAGLNLGLSDSATGSIDLGRWDRLEVQASCTPRRQLRIQILSDDLPPGSIARDSTRSIYHAVEYSPDGTLAAFPWLVFTIPAWWRDQFSRQDIQRLDLLDRFRAIEFQSGDSPSGRDSSVVDIQVLDLVGPDRVARSVGWGLLGLGLAGFAFALVRARSNSVTATTAQANPALVPGQVVLEDPRARQRTQLVQRLQEQFADPELSLESFAGTQGISPRLVATLIKEATQLHFKGALNELRLTEAARLLKDSRGNISEIAFAVGFQSASHFGRAFRDKYGQSPSEFRNGGAASVKES